MVLTQLSLADQRLIESLYAERVLHEAKLDVDLSHTLVVTDPANLSPEISVNAEVLPAQVIAVLPGACVLHNITSDASHEERRAKVLSRVRSALLEQKIDQIALVASAPQMNLKRSFVDTIDQLRSAEEFVRLACGNRRPVHNFICVQFPDNRTYTFQIDTPAFHAWYDKYEQEVLGRQDDLPEQPNGRHLHSVS